MSVQQQQPLVGYYMNYNNNSMNNYNIPPWLQECCRSLLDATKVTTSLNLNGKQIENEYQMNVFCTALNKSNTVTELDMSFSLRHNPHLLKIFCEKVLLASANNSSNIETLWLLNNNLTDEVIETLAQSLLLVSSSSSSSFHHVHLDGNSIGDKGVIALARTLSNPACCTIQWLSLRCNYLYDHACEALAQALRMNCNNGLRVLRIGSNHQYGLSRGGGGGGSSTTITIVGAKALEAAIKQSPCVLQELRIGGTVEGLSDDNITTMEQQHAIYDRLCMENLRINDSYNQLQSNRHEFSGTSSSYGLWSNAIETIDTKPDLVYNVIRSEPNLFQ